jgi:hypothetical protein
MLSKNHNILKMGKIGKKIEQYFLWSFRGNGTWSKFRSRQDTNTEYQKTTSYTDLIKLMIKIMLCRYWLVGSRSVKVVYRERHFVHASVPREDRKKFITFLLKNSILLNNVKYLKISVIPC